MPHLVERLPYVAKDHASVLTLVVTSHYRLRHPVKLLSGSMSSPESELNLDHDTAGVHRIPQSRQKSSFKYCTETWKQANLLVFYEVTQLFPKLWDEDNLGSAFQH